MRKMLAPVGATMGALIVGVGYILTGQQIISLGLPIWAWQGIGAIIFFVSIAAIIYGLQKQINNVNPEIPSTSSKVPRGLVGQQLISDDSLQNLVGQRGITLYESRDKAPDLIKELSSYKKAWVLWHVGGMTEPGSDYTKIQRMILVHPDSVHLGDLATITLSNKDDLHKRLIWLIEKMVKLRTRPNEPNIHLYRGLPSTVLLTFSNPERNNPKVLIQIVVPYEKATKRPCILVEKSTNELFYGRIVDYFEEIFQESKNPEDDPYT